MTKGTITDAIRLTGDDSAYPNSVPWAGDITLSFIETSLPSYYSGFDYPGFIGVQSYIDPSGNTVTHSWGEAGALAAFTLTDQQTIFKAALGDASVLGFNQFTRSTIVYDPTGVGDITFGKLNFNADHAGGVTFSVGSELNYIWSNTLLGLSQSQMAGDIWVFQSNFNDQSTYVHELGHALGLNHTFNDFGPFGHDIPSYQEDSNKYSVMAYADHPGELRASTEWQIYDIAALQYMYGSGLYNNENTNYSIFDDGINQDRITSLWDSGGTDTIDASAYVGKSYIDLRPGHFSSIGPHAFSSIGLGSYDIGKINDDYTVNTGTDGVLGRKNISIAFGAYIENAIGSVDNDVLVGNQFSNILTGNEGNDLLFADGFAIQHANSVLAGFLGLQETGLESLPSGELSDADYSKIDKGIGPAGGPDRSAQIDKMDGGAGNDLLVGGWGDDTLRGGDNDDILIADRGKDTLMGGEGTDRLMGEDGEDRLDGGAGIDQAFGGEGDDFLVANLDNENDDLNGGGGEDTVVYQYETGNSRIEIINDPLLAGTPLHPRETPADFGITIINARDASGNDGGFGTDLLTSVEKAAIEAGNGNDTLVLTDDSELRYLKYVDLGSQDADGLDKVDLSANTRNSFIDLAKSVVTVTQSQLPSWAPKLISSIFTSDNTLSVRHAEEAIGGNGNDVLHGSSGKIGSDAGYSILRGGAGSDELVAAGWETHFYGGLGGDGFRLGSGTWIEDGESGDRASYGGIDLHGGVKQWWMEGGFAYAAQFSTLLTVFPVVGAELLYTASFFIDQNWMKFATYRLDSNGTLEMNLGWGQAGAAAVTDYHIDLDSGLGSAGLAVFEASAASGAGISGNHLNTFINLALYAGFGHGMPGSDPLVLDLNGDGFNLTTEANSKAYFEFDTDGFAEHTGWVRATDGFLVRDANANGKIDNVTEMFGNATANGFDVLAGYDSNLDGAITTADSVYADLQVWQDLNQDGVTDAGELKSLAELGIVSISLTHAAPADPTSVGGNAITHLGSFTRADGSTGGVANVVLATNDAKTKWLGDATVDSVAAILPQLAGSGEMRDLRVAMSADLTLESEVAAFVANTSNDLSVLKSDAEAILYRWAGVDGVTATAIGSNGFDARKLAFLEKLSGVQLMPRDAMGVPELDNLDSVEALWTDQLTRQTLRLVVQGPLADTFAGLTYREDIDLLVADDPNALADLLHRVIADLPSDSGDAAAMWAEWAPLLGVVSEGMVRSDANVVRNDFLFAQLLRAADGIDQPLSLEALVTALGIPDLRLGTTGADTLSRGTAGQTAIYYGDGGDDIFNGGTGQDVYVFGHSIGHSVINDNEPNPAGDRIRFAFLDQADVTLARDGNDLLITVTATGETVRVTGQFAPVVPIGSDVLLSTDKGVEDIQFADGSIMEIPEIMAVVGKGSDGDDHLVGTMHSDVLTGGKGNDLVEGGDDADLYVFNRGDGNDIFRDQQSTPLLRAADLLVFGDDIAPEDLVYSRAGATGDDLLISVAGGGGSMLIQGQFAYTSLGYNGVFAPNSRIEAFAFRNYGDSFSNKDLQQQLIADATTDGADTTRGFGDDDSFFASAGNDVLIGMDGADTYYWGAGAGNDSIREQAQYIDITVGLGGISLTTRADIVQFSADINPASLIFTRDYDTTDLVITNSATGETLKVDGQFNSFQTGVLGAQWFDRVEWFAFADGSAYSWQDIEAIVTTGSDGDDRLRGDILADHMVGGLGDDLLSGGGGGDTYVFNAGDGHDIIHDYNETLIGDGFLTAEQTIDVVELGEGIAPGDISFTRNGSSITLTIGTSGDAITLQGQDDYIQTGVFGAIPTDRIEQVKFHDGTLWTWQDINQKMIAAQTTAGDDITEGFTLSDRFEKSAGDDVLKGGDSADTYVFGVGAGHDMIKESVSNVLYGDDDSVEFDATIAPADVSVARDGNDLVFTLASGDSLRIDAEFDLQTLYTWTDVENFRFTDGTVWTKADVQQQLLQSTAGDDHLLGFYSSDDLDGGAGNDLLEGGDGSDTYHFNRGYGNDEILEWVTEANSGDYDRLAFGPGLLPEDLGVARDGNDLVLTVLDTGETMRITDQFNFSNWFAWNDVELFTFANGTQWTDIQVAARLTGGTAGDDHLLGTFRSDTMDGKAGNDLLEGGDGSDIYLFGRGDGQDEIRESLTNANLGEDDELRFGADITLADLGFVRDGLDLVITIIGTTDSVRVTNEFNNNSWFSWNDIERFTFTDGSFITRGDVQQVLLTGTGGDDHIIGFFDANTLDGGAGDDLLEGLDGADTYVFGRGYGHDYVRETKTDGNLSDYDTVALAAGITPGDVTIKRDGYNLIIELDTGDTLTIEAHFAEGYNEPLTFNDIDRILFADGQEWSKSDILLMVLQGTPGDDILIGGAQSDVLDGGAGNDMLKEEEGSDFYVWGTGYGNDTIQDRYDLVTRSEFDQLTIHGVLPEDLQVARNGNDLILTIPSGETLTVSGQLHPWGWTDIEQINFDNGASWSQAEIFAQVLLQGATSGNDAITGFSGDDVLIGLGGNDTLNGVEGNDTFNGGAGDDYLRGDIGNDVYRFDIGGGHDTIEDQRNGWDTGSDAIEFGTGITPGDVTVSRDGQDLLLTLVSGDSVRIVRGALEVGAVSREIEQVRFANGSVWTSAQLRAMALGATPGNDSIDGSSDAEPIAALAGNDFVNARAGDDIITGGAGNDTLCGEDGDDIYRYAIGDGDDIINDNIEGWGGGNKGNDTIEFGAGIGPSQIRIAVVNGSDYLVTFAGQAGSLLLVGTAAQQSTAVERFTFADGTIWTYADMVTRSLVASAGNDSLIGSVAAETIDGLAGDDFINAKDGNDILIGGTGDDVLAGQAGDDIYRYAAGDGDDIINDNIEGNNGAHGFDSLELGAGITVADTEVSITGGGEDFKLTFGEGTGSVTLVGAAAQRSTAVDQVVFADGTVWAFADLQSHVNATPSFLIGTNQAETLQGGAGSQVIRGKAGNDTLQGGDGSDEYRYASGDGSDWITDQGASTDIDTLRLTDLNPGDISLIRSGLHLYVQDDATGQQISIDNQFWDGHGDYGIERIVFADGSVWDRDRIQQESWIRGDDGNNSLYGSSLGENLVGGAGADEVLARYGNDVLVGGTGDDYLAGGAGDDTYRFDRGDGQDVIVEGGHAVWDGGWGGDDRIVLGAGITPSDVTMTRTSGGADLYFDFGDGDGILVGGAGPLTEPNQMIEHVDFADGTEWNQADILARLTNSTAAADTVIGTSGNDILRGLGGADVIDGRDGNDQLSGDAGDDTVIGGNGDDILNGGTGNDELEGDIPAGVATGPNLILNGSFEQAGTILGGGGWGRAVADMPGWAKVNSQGLEQTYNGFAGIGTTDGDFWLDLDSGGGSGSNVDISQTISALTAGDTMLLMFDHANRTNSSSGAFEVYWNGTLVATVDQGGTTMTTTSIDVTAVAGDNVVRFLGIGAEDNAGAALDNVRLFGKSTTGAGIGDDDLTGGPGDDVLTGGAGSDVARYAGLRDDYQLTTTNGILSITDLAPTIDGDDGTDQLFGIESLLFKDQTVSLSAPIVLDLDGNGTALTSLADSNALFDMNADGVRDRTSWIGSGDALLFLDRNHDGTVSGIDEISFTSDKPGAATDLEGLAAFDSDGDGKLSSGDQGFADFGLWRDANGNGSVDANETFSLADAGVDSINLVGTPTNANWEWGSGVALNIGSFTRSDGSVGSLADIALMFEAGTAEATGEADEDQADPATGISSDVWQAWSGGAQYSASWRQFDVPLARVPIGLLIDEPAGNASHDLATRNAARLAESIASFMPTAFGAFEEQHSGSDSNRDLVFAAVRSLAAHRSAVGF